MRFLLGLAAGAVIVLAAEYGLLTHAMPVAAYHATPLPLERWLTGRALHGALAGQAARPAPIPADAANLLAGARIYRESCAVCHGAPGEARRSAIAAGMFPRPPRLLAADEGVTDDPVGETYWKVRNGIRLTGMPAFEGALSDTALWQVSLLLLEADHLPEAVRAVLR